MEAESCAQLEAALPRWLRAELAGRSGRNSSATARRAMGHPEEIGSRRDGPHARKVPAPNEVDRGETLLSFRRRAARITSDRMVRSRCSPFASTRKWSPAFSP